ncbi:MAG: hypothetical protein AAFQ82_25310, partial [Myxococcota bacterium]
GHGYLDSNWGSEPLQEGFTHWNWSRTGDERETYIHYDCHCPDGSSPSLALRFDALGRAEKIDAAPLHGLAPTGWRIARESRGPTTVLNTLEDTPFYARSLIETQVGDVRRRGVHESLSLRRFAHPVVRLMLPFRMPRIRGRAHAVSSSDSPKRLEAGHSKQ